MPSAAQQLDDRVVSPELALVDPELAAFARRRHGPPADTLGRIESSSRRRDAVATVASADHRRGQPLTGSDTTDVVTHRVAIASATVAACIMGTALVVGVRVNFDGSPAGAGSVLTSHTAESPPTTTMRRPARPAAPTIAPNQRAAGAYPRQAAPQRFAWAPVPGASGYHVELFRQGNRVFEADTSKPQIVLRASWKVGKATRRLTPGAYQWYVWPRVDERLQPTAIVQARLVVPAG